MQWFWTFLFWQRFGGVSSSGFKKNPKQLCKQHCELGIPEFSLKGNQSLVYLSFQPIIWGVVEARIYLASQEKIWELMLTMYSFVRRLWYVGDTFEVDFLIQFLFCCVCLAFAVVWQYVLYHQSFNLRERQLKVKETCIFKLLKEGCFLFF